MALRATPLVRWLMPLGMILGVAMFVYSHLDTVDIENMNFALSVEGGTEVPVYQIKVYDFALCNTIKMMWDSGAWPLAILVVWCSVIWVYLKMASLLVLWCVGRSVLLFPSVDLRSAAFFRSPTSRER